MAKRAADVEAGPPAPAPKKNHYVFRHGDGWAVKAARARRITSVHPTRDEAEEAAAALAWPEAEVFLKVMSSHGFVYLQREKTISPEDELLSKIAEEIHAQYLRGEWPE